MTTSFKKNPKGKLLQINGTKASLHNNQLLISTGVPSLDAVLGGGVAVGTVVLIEEDTYGNYSKLLLKYFLSEGVMSSHHLMLASADSQPDQLVHELPSPIIDDPGAMVGNEKDQENSKTDQRMNIAWRYQHLPKVQTHIGSGGGSEKFGHYYDLTKSMEPSLRERVPTTVLDMSAAEPDKDTKLLNPAYQKLLQEIHRKIEEEQFGTAATKAEKNILRIGIHSLGSPQWGEEGWNLGVNHPKYGGATSSSTFDPSLYRFLYALRAILRSAFATCVITMPTHLFQEVAFTKRIEHMCDTVLRLEAFAGSDKEQNPAYKEYHGLFHIVKLPRLNSLTCYRPDTMDLAFKLRRKKFTIERLHLPPELSETVSRGDQEDQVKLQKPGALSASANIGCGSGHGKSKLDF